MFTIEGAVGGVTYLLCLGGAIKKICHVLRVHEQWQIFIYESKA